MPFSFPKKEYQIEILSKYAEYLDRISAEKQMTPSAVIMSALTWYQRVMETPGAREAVDALLPKMSSKKAPMPTADDLQAALKRIEADRCVEYQCAFYPDCRCGDNEGYRGK